MKSEYDTVDNVDELLDQLKPLFPGGILDYNGNEREEGICLNTIIRGATYTIEYSIEYPDHLSLRIDRSKVDERKNRRDQKQIKIV